MSPRDWRDRIRDILEAINEIQRFTQDLDYEAFKGDDKSVRAVEMNFIIIGEAAAQIPQRNRREIYSDPMELNARYEESNCTCLFQSG